MEKATRGDLTMSNKDTPSLKKNKPSLRATMKAFQEKKSGKKNELIF
jgi:hypothetical protein